MLNNESSLSIKQMHFLRYLLDGKREMTEEEAVARIKNMKLDLPLPCVSICISPYYLNDDFTQKDELIQECSEFVCRRLDASGFKYYCLTNTYDNIQVIFPTDANDLSEQDIDVVFINLHRRFTTHFGMNSFIGIGSIADKYAEVSRSAMEAMEMLAYKNYYADRGVINIKNTTKFKQYSVYGEDIKFARVIGRFKDGDLPMMAVRLDELIQSLKGTSQTRTSINRTFVELTVNILHIASNGNVAVDDILNNKDPYTWIMEQSKTELLKEWLLDLSSQLLFQMETNQKRDEGIVIKQACDYIETHITKTELSLLEVSEAVGLSSAYFSELFKNEKGIGFNKYLTENRLSNARSLLSSTNMTVEEIACMSGFASSSYFGRVFRKNYGMTPSDYRKNK